jgi:catechol 2,3-dioxygenase-like lactoylglutathione lyase family enzyme
MGGPVAGLQEVVLWARDVERSLGFYRDLLGLQVFSPEEMPSKFLRAGEEIAGVPQVIVIVPHPDPEGSFSSRKRERPMHHLAFVVAWDAFDDLKGRCAEAGLETREGQHPIFTDSKTFYTDDPEGNEVEIIARPV